LLAAVQRAVGGNLAATPAEVFAVMGAKGGVGATTLAVNLATALSAGAKGKTLLIDLHPACGDAALFLGVEPSFTMTDALENTHRLDEAFLRGIVMKTAAGPDLLASPERSAAMAVDADRLSTVVEFASRCYRFVVLDVPRSEPALEKTLGLAKTITVVATQELAAIRSASRIAGALRTRFSAERVRVVVNRYDTAAEIGSEDLERAIGGRIGHKFPSNYRLAIDALNKGRPIVVDNHNKLSAAFASYAKTLTGLATPAADHAAPAPAGLLGRFTRRR
jgi:pilus assembly protein CpaE